MELNNEKQMPKSYIFRHMVPGVVGYANENILVKLDTIKKMMPTFAGKPIYVGHQPVDISQIKEQADGYIFDMFYNELDGWFYSRGVINSDKGHAAIANGWAVSNAYIPLSWNHNGGQYLAIDFAKELLNGDFTHLAIVSNPRYEEAKIFTLDEFAKYQAGKRSELTQLTNSKETKGIMMFKFKRNEITEKEITNAADLKDTDVATLEDGTEITYGKFKEMLNAKMKKNEGDETAEEKAARELKEKENAKKAKKNDSDDMDELDNEYDCDGEKVTMKDLMNSHRAMKNSKKNEADTKGEEEEKKNAKDFDNKVAKAAGELFFKELQNAKEKHMAELKTQSAPSVDTSGDKLSRGKKRY